MRRGDVITTIGGKNEELRSAPMNVIKPVREPNLQADVLTPAMTASVAAFVSFLLIIAFTIWQLKGEQLPLDIVLLATVVGLCVWLAVFFWSIGWIRKTIHMIETVAHIDITGDGQIGAPGYPYVYNNYRENSKTTKAKSDFDRWREGFYEFVDYVYQYGTTTAKLRSDGFTDSQIDSYRSYLMSMGIAAWRGKSHKEGWYLVVDEIAAQDKINRLEWTEQH